MTEIKENEKNNERKRSLENKGENSDNVERKSKVAKVENTEKLIPIQSSAMKKSKEKTLSFIESSGYQELEAIETLRIGVIKRIMGLDVCLNEKGDIQLTPLPTTSDDALYVISKSTELFIQDFILRVLENNPEIIRNQKKNIIKYAELVNTSRKHQEFQFLYELLPEI